MNAKRLTKRCVYLELVEARCEAENGKGLGAAGWVTDDAKQNALLRQEYAKLKALDPVKAKTLAVRHLLVERKVLQASDL